MIVAITQRVVREPIHGEIRDALSHDWYRFLPFVSAKTIVPVPNVGEEAGAWLESVNPQLLVLSGGNDVEYGQCPPRPRDTLNGMRDRTEIALLECALSKEIPVLGVCRGMQLIHAYYGGLLLKREGHAGTVHEIRYRKDEGGWSKRRVNSYHNYCIDESVDNPLIPIAYDILDGAVEAFVHRDSPLLGIMWHPERNLVYTDVDLIWIKQLITKARREWTFV
jgi:Predicted glutamine amidotransferases